MARLINADTLIAWIKGSQQMTSKMKSIICYIKTMPAIDAVSVDEWCHDCKEYDKEKHSCPRFNRVIRTALKDADMVSVVRCKECEYFEFDSWAKVNEIPIIVAHEICKFWGSGCGCKTDSDGYCSFGERKEADHE